MAEADLPEENDETEETDLMTLEVLNYLDVNSNMEGQI